MHKDFDHHHHHTLLFDGGRGRWSWYNFGSRVPAVAAQGAAKVSVPAVAKEAAAPPPPQTSWAPRLSLAGMEAQRRSSPWKPPSAGHHRRPPASSSLDAHRSSPWTPPSSGHRPAPWRRNPTMRKEVIEIRRTCAKTHIRSMSLIGDHCRNGDTNPC